LLTSHRATSLGNDGTYESISGMRAARLLAYSADSIEQEILVRILPF
jgi:hypothetical protein